MATSAVQLFFKFIFIFYLNLDGRNINYFIYPYIS
jgi:hypothetical protein